MEFRFENWREHWEQATTTDSLATTAAFTELTCPSNEDWATFCETITPSLVDPLSELAESISANPRELTMGMLDNYFHVAVAAGLSDLDRSTPATAWAAYNKSMYPGFRDELSVIRYLLWAGFDVNASDGERAAIHYLCVTKHGSGTMPRGVSTLLMYGADPNLRREDGDTPLIGVSAFVDWNAERGQVFRILVAAGADPYLPVADGSTPIQLLQQFNAKKPHPDRQELIDELS